MLERSFLTKLYSEELSKQNRSLSYKDSVLTPLPLRTTKINSISKYVGQCVFTARKLSSPA